jgi:hypothetical protein
MAMIEMVTMASSSVKPRSERYGFTGFATPLRVAKRAPNPAVRVCRGRGES